MEQILRYDKWNIKPDFVFLVKGNFLHKRKDREIKDYEGTMRELLYNNYITAFTHTRSKFSIINNIADQDGNDANLDEISSRVIVWIDKLLADSDIVDNPPRLF